MAALVVSLIAQVTLYDKVSGVGVKNADTQDLRTAVVGALQVHIHGAAGLAADVVVVESTGDIEHFIIDIDPDIADIGGILQRTELAAGSQAQQQGEKGDQVQLFHRPAPSRTRI